MEPLLPERYDDLLAHVDAVFADVRARHAASVRCIAGCNACCHVHLTLLPVEAARVQAAIEALPEPLRARVAASASGMEPTAPRCPLLQDGRCSVYEARPLVCRTQGLPLRLEGEVETCGLNFTGGAAPDDAVLDADAVNDQLVAVDFFQGRRLERPVSIVEVVEAATAGRRSEPL